MSTTATMDGRLYAVPDPTTKERLGLLLRLRRAARNALDTLLALPRGAAGWVLRHTRTVLTALADNPTLLGSAPASAASGPSSGPPGPGPRPPRP